MKQKIFFIILLFVLLISINLNAQDGYSFHIGGSFPSGDFAEDLYDDDDAGGAGIGLNAGIKYVYPLNETGLGLFLGVDLHYSPLSKDSRDDIEENENNDTEITFRKYYNVPISVGMNYQAEMNEKVALIGNLGLTANFLQISDVKVKNSYGETSTIFDLANSMGLLIGGGILINDKTTISINYYNLGEHDVDYEHKYKYGDSISYTQKDDFDLKVDIVTLSIGLIF